MGNGLSAAAACATGRSWTTSQSGSARRTSHDRRVRRPRPRERSGCLRPARRRHARRAAVERAVRHRRPPGRRPRLDHPQPVIDVSSGRMQDRSHLLTEQRLPESMNLDAMSVGDAVALMNAQDAAPSRPSSAERQHCPRCRTRRRGTACRRTPDLLRRRHQRPARRARRLGMPAHLPHRSGNGPGRHRRRATPRCSRAGRSGGQRRGRRRGHGRESRSARRRRHGHRRRRDDAVRPRRPPARRRARREDDLSLLRAAGARRAVGRRGHPPADRPGSHHRLDPPRRPAPRPSSC